MNARDHLNCSRNGRDQEDSDDTGNNPGVIFVKRFENRGTARSQRPKRSHSRHVGRKGNMREVESPEYELDDECKERSITQKNKAEKQNRN